MKKIKVNTWPFIILQRNFVPFAAPLFALDVMFC